MIFTLSFFAGDTSNSLIGALSQATTEAFSNPLKAAKNLLTMKKSLDNVKRVALWSTAKFFRLAIRAEFNNLEPNRVYTKTDPYLAPGMKQKPTAVGITFKQQIKSNPPQQNKKTVKFSTKLPGNIGGKMRNMIFAHVAPDEEDMQVGMLDGGQNLPGKYKISQGWIANFRKFQAGGDLNIGNSLATWKYLGAIGMPIKRNTVLKTPQRQVVSAVSNRYSPLKKYEENFLKYFEKKLKGIEF